MSVHNGFVCICSHFGRHTTRNFCGLMVSYFMPYVLTLSNFVLYHTILNIIISVYGYIEIADKKEDKHDEKLM